VKWIYADAGKYLKGFVGAKPASMDVIIIDCTDHTAGAAKVLYTDEFYSYLYKLLKPGGMRVLCEVLYCG
jgi:spermidine synthase